MNTPKQYVQDSNLQIRDNIYVLEKFFNFVEWGGEQNQTVLDVGCGEGYVTQELLLPKLPKCVKEVIGCDASETMLEFARKMRKNQRLRFFQMDLGDRESCKEIGGHFDHIFSFFCIHWLRDQKKAFENIYTLLKPGGDMLLSFLGTTPIFEIYLHISQSVKWAPFSQEVPISPYHNTANTEHTIKQILKDIGFEDSMCVVKDRVFVFKNWSHLKKCVTAVNPCLTHFSPKMREEYINDFKEECRKYYKSIGIDLKLDDNENERIPTEYKLIVVYAKRPKNTTLLIDLVRAFEKL